MNHWTSKEIQYLKENYCCNSNKFLIDKLKRSSQSINYIANKLGLKKDYATFCKTRKRSKVEVDKNILEKLYSQDKKSVRKIASELRLSRNTISYYLIKFGIQRRSISEANKQFYSEGGKIWKEGLTKDNDIRIQLASLKMKETFKKKKLAKIKEKENLLGESLNDSIFRLYWKESLTQKDISEKLKISRDEVIKLMSEFEIPKRPNFDFISKLKGKNHPLYGKKWEEIYGIDKAKKFKEEQSLRSRKLIIDRLANNRMPFLNTSIEKILAKELTRRNISFIPQYNLDNKFACDFAIPECKLIIECDGDYWHVNPLKSNPNHLDKRQIKNLNRDKFKDEYIRRKGWIILRFFESDIKSSVVNCVDQIENQIRKVMNPFDSLNVQE